MRLWALLLAALMCAACARSDQQASASEVTPAFLEAATATTLVAESPEQRAAAARRMFFAQINLYMAGSAPRADRQLGEMLSAMGREDLIDRSAQRLDVSACPRNWVEAARMTQEFARDRQIVIVGEAAHEPRHRAFIEDMLGGLKRDGFTIYASDALSADHPQSDDAVPLSTEGVLSREPAFGRLLRKVKSLDMAVIDFAMDPADEVRAFSLPREERVELRLAVQTDHLMDPIFNENSKAKVIIHVSNTPDRASEKDSVSIAQQVYWLAQNLKAETGTTPLTIVEGSCGGGGTSATVVRRDDRRAKSFAADLIVAHPQPSFTRLRPNWRRARGERAVAIPAAFTTERVPVLIEARRAGETALSVPDDRLLLLPDERTELLLPPGAYRLEAWTEAGAVAAPVDVVVK